MPESQPQLRTIGELADTNPEALGVGADPRASFRYVDLSSVTAGTVAWNSAPEVTLLTAPSRARRVLRRGDILFGTVRPNLQSHGYVNWTGNGTLVGSTGFSVIRARAGVSDPRYLFHCIMSSGVTAQANRDAVGSSYPALNDSDVRRFEVFAPPVDEQVAVAQILDTLDTTIRQTEAMIEKLKQVKQGLLHDLLTRGIDANGALRPPQSQAPHLYKDSPLGWIPREWEVTTLANMLSVRLGFAFRSEDYVERGLLNFRVVNIGRGESAIGDAAYLPASFWDAFPRQQLTGGEIVIVMVGATTGKLGRVPKALCPALQNQNMWNLVPLPGLNREFLWHLMPGAVSRHLALAQGSARDFLTQSAFLRTDCVRPDEIEQECIVSRIDAIDADIHVNRSLAGKLQALKSGLMDDLLTGRVRVTPLLA